MRIDKIKNWSTEKISQCVFYVLLGVSSLVFLLFFLVGYDMPFEENPDFNAPLFTNVLIFLMWGLLIGCFLLAIYSLVRSSRKDTSQDEKIHGVPARKISRVTWLGTLGLLVLTFLVGSSTPIGVNGNTYGDWLWLKISDMLVYTSIILLLGAIVAVIFGATRYIRKGKA